MQHRLHIEILAMRRTFESWIVGAEIPVTVTLDMSRNLCRIVILLAYACTMLDEIWLYFRLISDGVSLTSPSVVESSAPRCMSPHLQYTPFVLF